MAQRYQLSPKGARRLFSKTAGLNGRSAGNKNSVAYVMRGGIRF